MILIMHEHNIIVPYSVTLVPVKVNLLEYPYCQSAILWIMKYFLNPLRVSTNQTLATLYGSFFSILLCRLLRTAYIDYV